MIKETPEELYCTDTIHFRGLRRLLQPRRAGGRAIASRKNLVDTCTKTYEQTHWKYFGKGLEYIQNYGESASEDTRWIYPNIRLSLDVSRTWLRTKFQRKRGRTGGGKRTREEIDLERSGKNGKLSPASYPRFCCLFLFFNSSFFFLRKSLWILERSSSNCMSRKKKKD